MLHKQLHEEIYRNDHELLELKDADVNALNAHGMSYMQLAAQEGKLHQLLYFLEASANINQARGPADESKLPNAYCIRQSSKTPLHLALEHGHRMVAEVLLVLGANPELAIAKAQELNQPEIVAQLENPLVDPIVSAALALYAVEKKLWKVLAILVDKMDPDQKREEISALIQYAFGFMAANKQSDLKEGIQILLKKLNGQPLLYQPHVYTATFFAAIQQSTMLTELNQTEADWVLALQQLQSQNMAINSCMALAPEEAKKQFLASKFSDANIDFPDLQPNQCHAYVALSALSTNATVYCQTPEEYNAIAALALQQKNYSAIGALFSYFPHDKPELFYTFLKNRQSNLAKFWFIGFGLSFSGLAMSLVEKKELLESLTTLTSSPQGILLPIISGCIDSTNKPKPEKLEAAKKLGAEDTELLVTTLQRCLQNRYAIPHFNVNLVKIEKEYNVNAVTPPKHSIELLDKLRAKDQAMVVVIFKRFGFDVIKEAPNDLNDEKKPNKQKKGKPDFSKLGDKVWKQGIMPFLDSNALQRVPNVSGAIQEIKFEVDEEKNPDPNWEENNKKALARIDKEIKQERMLNELEVFKRFHAALDEDLANRSCFEGRLEQVELVGGFSAAIAFGLWTFFEFIQSSIAINTNHNAQDKLIMDNGRSCWENFACSHYYESICQDLCAEENDIALIFTFSLMGFLFNFFWLIPLIDYMANIDWSDRFHHLAITDLSEDTQNEFEEVKRLAPHKNHRIMHLDNVGDIRKQVLKQKTEMQMKVYQLNGELKGEIDENEEKIALEENAVLEQKKWFKQQRLEQQAASGESAVKPASFLAHATQGQLLAQFSVLANSPRKENKEAQEALLNEFTGEDLFGDDIVDQEDLGQFHPPAYKPPANDDDSIAIQSAGNRDPANEPDAPAREGSSLTRWL